MALDVYAPCPCGSGKKLKFCCQDIAPEMEKVSRLQQSNQHRMALHSLEKLEQTHPDNPWVLSTRASTLLADGDAAEAEQVLRKLIHHHPEHVFGLALYATAAFFQHGFNEYSKPIIHRAFQRCSRALPHMMASVALNIGAYLYARRHAMGTRAHLTLAMRLAPQQEREAVFMQLVQLDGNQQIPYPQRSVHPLQPYRGEGELAKQAAQASRLADIGCWEPAARVFTKMAEQEPNSAALWANAALCRAWDGDDARATVAFRKASEITEDKDLAVEYETLAQLLELQSTVETVPAHTYRYDVKSIGRLLTHLQDQPQLFRVPDREQEEDDGTAGQFIVLDRPIPTGDLENIGHEHLPKGIADLLVFDAADGQPAHVLIHGVEGERIDTALRVFEEGATDAIDTDSRALVPEDVEDAIPKEHLPLLGEMFIPAAMSHATRRRVERDRWNNEQHEIWPNLHLTGLGGKTPLEAAGDPAMKTKLAAALYVFDTRAQQMEQELDFAALRSRLQLEAPQPIAATPELAVAALSPMQLHRLVPRELSDDQIISALNRALLLQYRPFLRELLIEALGRPSCVERMDAFRAYLTIADIEAARGNAAEALRWLAEGEEKTASREDHFVVRLQLKMRELSIRVENPDDPELHTLLAHFRDYYLPKLPDIGPVLAQLLEAHGIPFDLGETALAGAGTPAHGSTTASGLWTPEAPQASGGGKKLWVPGLD